MAVKSYRKALSQVSSSLLPFDRLQDQFDMLLTVHDIMRAFDISHMTVHAWRKKRRFPAIVIRGDGRDSIRFHPKNTIKWAREQREPIVDIDALIVDRSTHRIGEGELV